MVMMIVVILHMTMTDAVIMHLVLPGLTLLV